MKQALSQSEEVWSYEWDYTMGAPDKTLWDYPFGGGSSSFNEGEGLYLASTSGNYAALRFNDYVTWLGEKAVYEIEVKVNKTAQNGFRIVCTSGNEGVSDKRGLQVTLNGNYLNVLTGGTGTDTLTKTAPVTYGEWHKVRLELDIPANSNKVYLDGTLITTVVNTDLSTQFVTYVWCLIQYGECYVRSVRYRKED